MSATLYEVRHPRDDFKRHLDGTREAELIAFYQLLVCLCS
ncbi:hypothetical protein ANK1_2012 [plant metagenome]|uniref:Uncharacterized protein n=1 Tax=plant metagenome TaxID=1297885 RepID=A0A484TF83_9ZZZZ